MAHLLRRTLKINAQRIKDTPALYFQLAPCIYIVSFQKAYGKDCRGGEAVPEEWSREAEPRKLLINSAVEQNIHFGDY